VIRVDDQSGTAADTVDEQAADERLTGTESVRERAGED